MTTFPQQSKGIPPSDYSRHIERLDREQAAFVKRRRQERLVHRLTWACWSSIVVLIAVVAWRGCS